MPGLSALSELSPNMVAALFGAGATLIAALINLRIAWRREVLDRLQATRGGPRARRGLLVAITILVVAAGVGGYAGAMYVMQREKQHTIAMRADLQQRIAQIQETAARFEQARFSERTAIEADARLLEDRKRGADGVTAGAVLGACRVRQFTGDGSEPVFCSEPDAVQARVCASIPAAARVYEVVPFARWADEDAAWSERRVALGARLASAAIGVQPSERTESAVSKQVCLDAASWDSQRALEVRLLVRYLPPDAADGARPASPPVQAAVKVSP